MDESEKKTTKRTFSHNINEAMVKEFDRIADLLPGNKFEVLEAMIRGFGALPEEIQVKLMSANRETRATALALLAGLSLPQASGRRARKEKP